jgi:toxin ParE1/3/4
LTEQAFNDIQKIEIYLSSFSKKYALNFSSLIIEKGLSLKSMPRRGRIIPELNLIDFREVTLKGYRILYHIFQNSEIHILTIHPISPVFVAGTPGIKNRIILIDIFVLR